MATRVFIDGEAGTTGLQIYSRLADRADIDLIRIDPALRKDAAARQEALLAADIAILCLPDAGAREAAQLVAGSSTRLIDASTAHRTDPDWTFGFAELTAGQSDLIALADRVSNPGCYSTGAIALIRPLREAGLLSLDSLISINAVSGYSGGGKAMIAEFENGTTEGGFVYGLGLEHKHLPEIQAYGLLKTPPIFVPSVGQFAQGMIVQIPLHLDMLPDTPSAADIQEVLETHYKGSSFVQVADPAQNVMRINPQDLNGSNDMRLQVFGHAEKRQVVLSATLDNLGKGASGAAVQALNLMIGAPVETGLAHAG